MTLTAWHLCSNRWNSAITEYALRSTQALKMQGWVSELSALPASPCEKRAKELKVSGPSFRFRFSELFALKRHAKKLKPSIIVTYGGPETFLARFLGVPTVRFRGQDSDMSVAFSRLNISLNMGFCVGVLTPAKVLADRFRDIVPDKKIAAVALGLDYSVFYARVRKEASRPRLLIVGRLDPIKGHEKFLDLFAKLLVHWDTPRPKPYLEIIGQSSNITSAMLRAKARTLGLEEGVDWGLIDARVPNLPERMANATLGVIPSLGSEVICRVAEEFLLSGTPVLVSKVGSLEECLINETFGATLMDNDDGQNIKLLQRWILRAFDELDADRIQRSKQAAEYFSLEQMGQNLSAFFTTLFPVTH